MQTITGIALMCMMLRLTSSGEFLKESGEYCQTEHFRAQCLKNEVILMKGATYGRMRIGRCITAGEVADQKSLVGEDPRYFGCSTDVLEVLDRKCSGKADCDVHVVDISNENIKPCFPGLVVYLEASYNCISLADEKRSCTVTVSKNPTHIISSNGPQSVCGTKSQPWIVEAPIGQKIAITLFDFTSSEAGQEKHQSHDVSCQSHGLITDKVGRRNTSVCTGGGQRQRELHLSTGNVLHITLTDPNENSGIQEFILRLEAVGCSDVIPPEDSWLRRNGDTIRIGCYSNQQTWLLVCNEGKWVGVLGNCSQDISAHSSDVDSNRKSKISKEEQVLAMVAIVGCTLAICLAIICIGALCLRRFYVQSKTKQDYKTLKYTVKAEPQLDQEISSGVATEFTGGNNTRCFASQQMPTYSVFGGDFDFTNVDGPTRRV